MNKAELIAAVAAAAEISKKDAETAVSATLDAYRRLKEGDKVQLVGSVLSRSSPALPAPAVTPVPRKLSRSPLPRCPCSRPARL